MADGRPIYLLPSTKRGGGTGHIVRCAQVVCQLEGSYLTLPELGTPGHFTREEVVRIISPSLKEDRICHSLPTTRITLVVDQRSSDPALIAKNHPESAIIGLDEGGECREIMDYLIDTITCDPSLGTPNVGGLLPSELPDHHHREFLAIGRVLIAFGGEDPGKLQLEVIEEFGRVRSELGDSCPEVWLSPGFLPKQSVLPDWVSYLKSELPLKEQLSSFDLVVTSFGLTAFEAVAAGTPVVVRDPSSYHKLLSRKAGFIPIPATRKKLIALLRDPQRLLNNLNSLAQNRLADASKKPSLPVLLSNLILPEIRCPGCGTSGRSEQAGSQTHRVVGRFPERTYRICTRCLLIYQLTHLGTPMEYGEGYFASEYAKQYGRTYLEDMPKLRQISRNRLAILRKKLPVGGKILDIGCAYGAFLSEVALAGYVATGIDLAPGAVEYAKSHFRLNVRHQSVEELVKRSNFKEGIEGITLWYVIEHIVRPDLLLAWAARVQEVGGCLAFSTPNGSGISIRLNREKFLADSPKDHHHIWTPTSAKKVLRRYGYRVWKVRITGHHPERFPGIFGRPPGRVLRLLWKVVSHIFALGDTFEIYALRREGGGAV